MRENQDELNPLYRAGDDEYGTDFDTTQLRQGGHGRVIHRDYLAHCLRWGWVARHVHFGDKILDAGCGQDVSLYDVIAGTKSFLPNVHNVESRARPIYVGVDLNPIRKKTGASWAYVEGKFDLTNLANLLSLPYANSYDWVVSLEVIEHMATRHGDTYLANLRDVVAPAGHLVLSTPVFNGKAAKNHIHEYTVPELQEKLERCGWIVESRSGTFMSWNDMVRATVAKQDDALIGLCENLREYLGPEVVACFLAPLFPDHSRNNLWICRPR